METPTQDDADVLKLFEKRCEELGVTYAIKSKGTTHTISMRGDDWTATAKSPNSLQDALALALLFM